MSGSTRIILIALLLLAVVYVIGRVIYSALIIALTFLIISFIGQYFRKRKRK